MDLRAATTAISTYFAAVSRCSQLVQPPPKDEGPGTLASTGAFCMRSLAVTYSGMAESHTTIGAERFHFRVRNGIGWFPLAVAARQTGKSLYRRLSRSPIVSGSLKSVLISSICIIRKATNKRLEVIWSSLTGN